MVDVTPGKEPLFRTAIGEDRERRAHNMMLMMADFLGMVGTLLLAAVLGSLVGWERERRDRPACRSPSARRPASAVRRLPTGLPGSLESSGSSGAEPASGLASGGGV